MFYTYALGWDVQDYRGAKIVWHGGAVFGFQAAVVLIPEKNVGFSIEINSEDGEMIAGFNGRATRPLSWITERRLAREDDRLQETNDGEGVEKISDRLHSQASEGGSVTST